jgi:hypothetical protein
MRTVIGPEASACCPDLAEAAAPAAVGKATKNASPRGIDLHTPLRDERFPQHATVIGQRLGIAPRPELPQQARGPLDIREQERHRSRGKVLPHQCIMLGECAGMFPELRGRWGSVLELAVVLVLVVVALRFDDEPVVAECPLLKA